MSSLLTFPAFSTALLSGESREELESLLEAYFTEYNPRTITEERSISEMVDAEWRLRRLRRAQLNGTTLSPPEFRRFEAHLIRIYDRALRNLLSRKNFPPNNPREKPASQVVPAGQSVEMHGAPN